MGFNLISLFLIWVTIILLEPESILPTSSPREYLAISGDSSDGFLFIWIEDTRNV